MFNNEIIEEAYTYMNEELINKLKHSVKIKENGCWEWIGCRNKYGYGQIRWNKTTYGAHRLSYNTFIGHIPQRMYVCQTCENPPCINPEHLFVGTASENKKNYHSKAKLGRKPKVYPRETKALLGNIDIELHTRIKCMAAIKNITIKKYVLQAIMRSVLEDEKYNKE